MTRAEHLAWCKAHALEYVDRGDLESAVVSMISDMEKHPNTSLTNPFLLMLGGMAIADGASAVRRWIEGFN